MSIADLPFAKLTPVGLLSLTLWNQRNMTEQTDRRAKESSPVSCVAEDLKCLGTADKNLQDNRSQRQKQHRSLYGERRTERQRLAISAEGTQKNHCQSDQPRTCFNFGNIRYSPLPFPPPPQHPATSPHPLPVLFRSLCFRLFHFNLCLCECVCMCVCVCARARPPACVCVCMREREGGG